jgi:hypothetical protein
VILVDTSVLVDFLAGETTPGTRYLERLVAEDAPFYLTSVVIQEVLQGARDEAEWRRLRSYLRTQLRVDPRDPLHTHLEAARIYFDCRRRGLTVRSTIDCLIAQIALEHDLAILHQDRDFAAIRHVRRLRVLP